jgi:hypothetical protein
MCIFADNTKFLKICTLNKLVKILLSLFVLLSVIACARIGKPPGGPIDEDPPVIVKSKPLNYATNYKRKTVFVGFDEFIKLEDAFTEFTISPPLEETPLPRTKGKGIVVDLHYADLDSFTYTLDFGESIVDNNESNPLLDFQFVVSILPHIDSFSISGRIIDAFTHQPDEEGMFVHLYSNLSDTMPLTTKPSYLARTNSEGNYRINHVAPGTYSIFVLKDANANMIFDMPSEIIGFANEWVHLYPDSFPVEPDSVNSILMNGEMEQTDTSSIEDSENLMADTDSVATDSIEFMTYGYYIDLFSFTEAAPYQQYLVEYDRVNPEKLQFIFNDTNSNPPGIRLLDTIVEEDNWYLLEANARLDTLVYWIPDSSLLMRDSITVELTYPETDTTGNLITTVDTLLLTAKIEKETTGSRGKSDGKERKGFKLPFGSKEEVTDTLPPPPPRVSFKNNINSSAHDLYRPVIFTPAVPVFTFDQSKINLVRMEDTLEFPAAFTLKTDSAKFRQLRLDVDFEPNTQYILNLYEGAFTDIYGRTIDSIAFKFTTQKDDHYGIVSMKLSNITSPVILQLLDPNEKVLKQKQLFGDGMVEFDFLNPGTYLLKLIFDDNSNGIWDTGDYERKLQPERVSYYPSELDVRSNWTLEYDWVVE